MKKIIAIFLLLQIVTNNAFAEELIKLPRLFTHFNHHSNEHKDTKDFFDFLHKHYSSDNGNENHSEKHNAEDDDCNLPFKHCGSCLNVHSPAVGFVATELNADSVLSQIINSNFISENDRIESVKLLSIWQPPKLA